MAIHCRIIAVALAGTLAGALAVSGAFAQAPASPGAGIVKRGEYLAIAGDCGACHTKPGGKPFAGGGVVPTPVGDVVSTNITPSKTAGIGNDTLGQFSEAVRRGIAADGEHLYPAMPYTSYAKITDEDIVALYAYFMQGVAPVDLPASQTHLAFPFNIRASMAIWNALFLDTRPFTPVPGRSAEWNRGAYIAEGLAHCSTCHSPRNLLMAESTSRALAGGKVGPWDAPNITSDVDSGIGGWSEAALVDYLKHGDAHGKGQAAGSMAEAIDASFRHLTDADLHAIAVYLKTDPAVHDAPDRRPRYAWGGPSNELATIRGASLPADPGQWSGPQLYDAWCATCHQDEAQGSFDGEMPPLYHNTALGGPDANNLVLVTLDGIHRRGEAVLKMPGFANILTDRQVATLDTWLLARYGNPAVKLTADQISALRRGGEDSHLVAIAQGAIALAVVVVLVPLVTFARRGWAR